MTDPLARLDKAQVLLAEARTLGDVKKIRDMAEAAKVYAKAAHKGRDVQNYAAELSLAASRKAGAILKTLPRAKPKAKGGRVRDSDYWRTLTESNTPYRTAQLWQRLADIPDEAVQRYLAFTKKSSKEISAAGLRRAVKGKKKATPNNPYDRSITIPLGRHEYLAIRYWAKQIYGQSPTPLLNGDQMFIREVLADFFRETRMGDSPVMSVKAIRAAIAEWLNRPDE
jgi:hypothetical protein